MEGVYRIGLDFGEIALARTYQDAELLTWIRQLARDNPKMTLFAEALRRLCAAYGRRATTTLATNCGSLDSTTKPTSRSSSARSSSR